MTIINAAAFTQSLVNSSDYFARSQPAIGYRCAVATATLVRVPKRKAPPSMVDAPQRLPRHQRLRRYLTHHDYLQGWLFSRIRCYKMCSRLHELYKGIRKQWLMGLNTLGLVAICQQAYVWLRHQCFKNHFLDTEDIKQKIADAEAHPGKFM